MTAALLIAGWWALLILLWAWAIPEGRHENDRGVAPLEDR